MESPGEYLKRERELRGVSLARIHDSTRVPMKYLEAIERDDYEGIHPTFVKGYIKSYCKVLGLDETDAALRFEVYIREHAAEAGRTETARPAVKKKTEAPRPSGEGKKSINAFVLAAAGIVIVAIIYFVAINKGPAPKVEPPTAQVEEVKPPEVPAPAAPLPQQATSAPPEAQVQRPEPQKPEQKAPAEKTVTPEKQAPAAKPAAPVAPAQKPAVTAPAPAAPAVENKPQATESAVKKHSLSVSATEQAWVKVGIDGAEPFDVLLREGESVSWKAAENFQVTIGNAGGVDVAYDGKQMPKLGESGQVVHMTLPGGVTKARPMPAPVEPKETEPAVNMPVPPAPAEDQGQ